MGSRATTHHSPLSITSSQLVEVLLGANDGGNHVLLAERTLKEGIDITLDADRVAGTMEELRIIGDYQIELGLLAPEHRQGDRRAWRELLEQEQEHGLRVRI